MEIYPAALPAALFDLCPDDLDSAVSFLRDKGLSKIEAMAAIGDKFGLSLSAAKAVVHAHAAWSERREADEAFHDGLVAAVSPEA